MQGDLHPLSSAGQWVGAAVSSDAWGIAWKGLPHQRVGLCVSVHSQT